MTYGKDKIHPDKKKEGNYLMFHQRKRVEEKTWLLIMLLISRDRNVINASIGNLTEDVKNCYLSLVWKILNNLDFESRTK